MTDNYWHNLDLNLRLWDSHNKCGRADHGCSWPVCPATFPDLRAFLVWVGFPVADKAIGIFGRDLNERGNFHEQADEVVYLFDHNFTPAWGPERASEATESPVQNELVVTEGELPLVEAEFQSLVVDSLNALVVASKAQNEALRSIMRSLAGIRDEVVEVSDELSTFVDNDKDWSDKGDAWLDDFREELNRRLDAVIATVKGQTNW